MSRGDKSIKVIELLEQGHSVHEILKLINVSESQARHVHRVWKINPKWKPHHNQLVAAETIFQIHWYYDLGKTVAELSTQFKLPKAVIRRIVTGLTYRTHSNIAEKNLTNATNIKEYMKLCKKELNEEYQK